ncbi:MAG: aminomethyl-transferring glycine dehydrogenase subunit GcvPB [Spirochaetota bacterium]
MSTIFDKSKEGKNRYSIPEWGGEYYDPIPETMCRKNVSMPDVGEVDVIRHYNGLSRMNFGVDTGMYPLGSCTMKHNPKINDRVAALDGFTDQHPLAGDELSQGSLEIMYELGNMLCQVTGMAAFSLMPAAGAHGELASVMIIRKYFEKKGEKRNVILIPDSAHGTNPASVMMCGFTVREVPSTSEGDVDAEELKKMVDGNVAAMMLTSPSTLGLFDRNVHVIADILHRAGALFYCDGANLNAVVGRASVSRMGFDIMHVNLHKTFSTPHGGGGPGSGPIGVAAELEPFLPVPVVERSEEGYVLSSDRPHSIGRIHSFYGNFLVMVRAYTYMRMLGAEGLREVADNAVLNANYLRVKLKEHYNLPVDRICMHEFVINDEGMPNHVTTNDIAKRLLDYGYHAPTVYFPLIIPGAMMIEPTETEDKTALDEFIEAMIAIKKEAEENPRLVLDAPQTTPVKRVDAVTAARKPVLKWEE